MYDMLKRKRICKENKSKKNQNTFKYGCKRVSRRCESYRMYLKGDSLHQAVMIVCELKLIFSYLKSLSLETFMHSCDIFTHNTHILCYF